MNEPYNPIDYFQNPTRNMHKIYSEAYRVLFDLEVAGLRLRDIRSVDPSLWVTNSVPAILVSQF